jgi:hypothetical protein
MEDNFALITCYDCHQCHKFVWIKETCSITFRILIMCCESPSVIHTRCSLLKKAVETAEPSLPTTTSISLTQLQHHYLMFCWSCIVVYQYSKTNVMHFSFNLLRIKSLYVFRALFAHFQEALHKRHLVYCVRVMSIGCYHVWSGTDFQLQPW